MKPPLKSYLFLSSAMLLVGTSVVAGKLIVDSLPIFLSTFLGLLIASLMFLPIVYPVIKRNTLTKSDYLFLSLQALLGIVLFRIFLFVGLKYVDAGYAGILTALQPAMISGLAFFFLKERQTTRQKFGILLAVVGLLIVYIANTQSINISTGLFLGTVFILLAIFGEACFSVFAKKVNDKVAPTTVAGLVTVLGCTMMIPLVVVELAVTTVPQFSLLDIGLVAYYGIVLTYVAFLLWFKGLSQVGASVAGVFTALAPFSGIILSAVVLEEALTLFELVGGVLIILSLLLVVYKPSQSPLSL